MDSDEHVLVMGGPQDRCAMMLDDEGMTLNVGGGREEGRTKLEKERSRELWERASAVALATVCAGALGSSAACGAEAGKKEWKDPGSKWGFGGSLSLVALSALSAALLGWLAKKECDKVTRDYKDKLGQVKKREPSAKIEITKNGHINIVSTHNMWLESDKSITLKAGANVFAEGNFKHKNFKILA